jgi:hypothetical protein
MPLDMAWGLLKSKDQKCQNYEDHKWSQAGYLTTRTDHPRFEGSELKISRSVDLAAELSVFESIPPCWLTKCPHPKKESLTRKPELFHFILVTYWTVRNPINQWT